MTKFTEYDIMDVNHVKGTIGWVRVCECVCWIHIVCTHVAETCNMKTYHRSDILNCRTNNCVTYFKLLKFTSQIWKATSWILNFNNGQIHEIDTLHEKITCVHKHWKVGSESRNLSGGAMTRKTYGVVCRPSFFLTF